MSSWLPFIVAAVVCVAVLFLYSPTLSFPFLNWDDQDVLVRNLALHTPGVTGWAFTTTYIEHYQPLAWLTWAAVDRTWGLTGATAHALNVALHALGSVLVFVLAFRLSHALGLSVLAALLFALHPLRVEVVAWASAMPYTLALVFALLSTLAFLDARGRRPMIILSSVLYGLSLLARPIALGLPAVLFALDWRPGADTQVGPYTAHVGADPCVRPRAAHVGADPCVRPRADTKAALWRVAPFVVLAVVAAVLESKARLTATLADVGVGARLMLALTAPLRYLWRTVVPINLTPLDALAVAPRAGVTPIVAAAAALVVISLVAWRWRQRHPGAAIAWLSYIALLVPAVGLVPSGLQATADRYTYVAAVPVSIGIAGGIAAVATSGRWGWRWLVPVAAAGAIVAFAWLTYQQTRYWRDSVALWTHAVEIDPSDVALYNLASAFAESGRRAEALARYDDVLRIVPDHGDARRNRDLLRAAVLEDEANRLAASGDLDHAIDTYRRAIALDPARTHAHAALGMALVQTGRATDALPHLREAIRLGALEPAIPNALAFSLVQMGRTREACDVLQAARTRFPGDLNVARNLEQLSPECR